MLACRGSLGGPFVIGEVSLLIGCNGFLLGVEEVALGVSNAETKDD